jgi:myosin heavy subunit
MGLWKILAAIMHIGNVKFKAQVLRRQGSDIDGCKVVDNKHLEAAATLLGVPGAALDKALVERSYTTMGETAIIPRTPVEAEDARDALAKALYAGMFVYLRNAINAVLGRRGLGEEKDRRQIGVLDIFGFEILQTNSFEQLCINYCNEKLQSHFNEECFRIEQEEYRSEGVSVAEVPYQDNGPCLELLENRPGAGGKSAGVFPMIEEELTTPGGSNAKLLEKLQQVHGKHAHFARAAKDGATTFKVRHYAGEVLYKVDGLIEKSRDLLHSDLEQCMLASTEPQVVQAMMARSETTAAADAAPARAGPSRQKLTAPSLGAQFARQLTALMAKLHATQPHFVKCIKPNTEKRGGLYVEEEVLTQLRYTGIFGLCQLRKAGYSDRPTLQEFFLRYRVLGRPWPKDAAALVQSLSRAGVLKPNMYVLGKTKVMLKHEQHSDLDVVLNAARDKASRKIGHAFRCYSLRKFWKLVCKARRAAKAAIKARGPVAALDAAYDLMDQLPESGMAWPEKTLIRALKERLRQEAEATTGLNNAIASKDLAALDAAIAVADNLGMDTAETRAAKALKAQLVAAAKAREALKAALAKPSRPVLAESLKAAEAAGLGDCAEAREVKALIGRMDAEEEATKQYEAAKAANNIAAMDAALGRFTELGLPLPKGAKAARDALAQKQARDKTEKEVRESLDKALKAKDVKKCEEVLQHAVELNITGKEVDNVRKFVKEQVEKRDAAAHAKAQAEAFELKMHSKVGLTQSDMAEMTTAVKRAEAAGPALSPEEAESIAMARETLIRADQAVKAGEVLKRALATKDYDKIQAAVEAAEALGINIAELDQARATLKTLEAAPLPAAVATGTMAQILDISRGARWRFEKFGGLRPQERFAKGRLMLASTKKKVQDGMLTYTKEVIPRSLLDLDSVLGKQAVSCHKCLLGFCGDRKTTYPAAAGHHVLMTGVQSVELRDEIFVQLCKHLSGNPDARSTLRGWILTCLCVDLFPPSVKFELYLLNFLGSACNDKAYGEYARYSLARLEEALDLDEAALENLVLERGLPSVEFIWHVLSGQSNPYRCSQIVAHRRPWQDSRA